MVQRMSCLLFPVSWRQRREPLEEKGMSPRDREMVRGNERLWEGREGPNRKASLLLSKESMLQSIYCRGLISKEPS